MERVVFPKRKQSAFFEKILRDRTIATVARELGVHPRSLSDWAREQYTVPHSIFIKALNIYNLTQPENISVRDDCERLKDAGRRGGIATYKKYGRVPANEEKRKVAWRQWWKRFGQHKSGICAKKTIHLPRRSARLAEFIGIMIGDGGITRRQVTITLNKRDDAEYLTFVASFIHELFGIEPSIIQKKDSLAINVVISRTALVEFLISLGLPQGDKLKHGLDIPHWIKEKPAYARACVRGIMDTDGCVFTERHIIKRREYAYPRLSIVSASPQLLTSIEKILQKTGFSPKIRRRRVNLESRRDIVTYFRKIGSSNPKHIQKAP